MSLWPVICRDGLTDSGLVDFGQAKSLQVFSRFYFLPIAASAASPF